MSNHRKDPQPMLQVDAVLSYYTCHTPTTTFPSFSQEAYAKKAFYDAKHSACKELFNLCCVQRLSAT